MCEARVDKTESCADTVAASAVAGGAGTARGSADDIFASSRILNALLASIFIANWSTAGGCAAFAGVDVFNAN